MDESSGIEVDPEVKFKTTFSIARIDRGTAFKLRYLKERWVFFNKELFGNEMEIPKFVILKAFKNPKILGLWSSQDKTISVAHKVFTLENDKQLLGTLVHEMAHEYDSEVAKTPMSELFRYRGHGPNWKHIMTSIGMPPDVAFTGDFTELMDKQQKDNIALRNATPNLAPNKITPESFNQDGYVYAIHINSLGKLRPVIIINNRTSTDKLYRALDAKDIED